MINANDNSGMVSRILEAIAREYRWPDYPLRTPPKHPAVEVAEGKLDAYAGRYEFANNRMLTFAAERGRLWTLVDGLPDEEFLPEADDRFHSAQRDVQMTFLKEGGGEVSGFLWKRGRQGAEGAAHRPPVPFPQTAAPIPTRRGRRRSSPR